MGTIEKLIPTREGFPMAQTHKSSYLSAQGMYEELFTAVSDTLQYPLVALTLTLKECKK